MGLSSFNGYGAIEAVFEVTKYDITAGASTVDLTNDTVDLGTSHTFKTGDCVSVYTAGSLPTGLSTATKYFAILVTNTKIAFATSLANAIAGTKVDLTAVGSGTISVIKNGFGIVDTGITLPANSVVTRVIGNAITTLGASTGTPTLALDLAKVSDQSSVVAVKAATAYSNAVYVSGAVTAHYTTPVKLSFDCTVIATTASASLNAGKYSIIVEYVPVVG